MKEVTGPDYAAPIAEELLQAVNAGDYEAYLKSFDLTADKAMTEDWFTQTVSLVQSKVGYYVTGSKVLTEVKPGEDYTDFVYKTGFSDEPDGVYVTAGFSVSDNRAFAVGIWFNSSKLFGN